MTYEMILIPWFYSILLCCGSLILCIPARAKVTDAIPEAEVSTTRPIVYDFKDAEYRNAWVDIFTVSYTSYGSQHTEPPHRVKQYFKLAEEHNFAIEGKVCCDWWNMMIRTDKPASPTKPAYYPHIKLSGKSRDWLRCKEKPTYPSYAGNGYGYVGVGEVKTSKRQIGTGIYRRPAYDRITNFEPWIKAHRAKYDNGYKDMFDDVMSQKLVVTKAEVQK